MKDILEKYLANGLRDFEGLSLNGRLPLKEETLNEILQEYLRAQTLEGPPAETGTPSAHPVNPRQLFKLVKKARVTAHEGQIVIDFELGV